MRGRKSTVTMLAETGSSRENKIAALCAVGLSNDAIWAAMELEYMQVIRPEDPRRDPKSKVFQRNLPAFDDAERERLGWAIRSVKGLMVKEDDYLRAGLEPSVVQSANDIEYVNRERFSCGIPSIDWMYGHTNYIHLEDGKSHKRGDPMIVNGERKVEHGLPKSFMSIWGGSPGVGKTRLAIALAKAINALGKRVLYFNGEADPSDFRGWVGHDVNGDLFKVCSSEMVTTQSVVNAALEWQAPVIIIDSFQMLMEVRKGERGTTGALSQFKLLKSQKNAGYPHIILISQLNKQEQLKGSNNIHHMVDGSFRVTRRDGHKNTFIVESMKMRGAEAPRGSMFRHVENGVECISTELATTPIYKLEVPTNNPVIAAGVVDPPKEEANEEESED